MSELHINTSNPAPLFDMGTVQRHHARALSGDFAKHQFLFDLAENEFASRLDVIKRDFPSCCFLGERQAGLLQERFQRHQIIQHCELLPIDPDSQSLIISTLDLHTVNSLPEMLFQIRHGLKEDGLFLGALFGGETLYELRQAMMLAESDIYGGVSPRVSPMIEVSDLSGLMQRAGFALPVVDFERVVVSYGDVMSLMHDLRGMGESNAVVERSRKYASTEFFEKVQDYYQQMFTGKDGRLEATFEIFFVLGWSPSSSQPQPLKRGSASHSLESVLNRESNPDD